MSKNDCHDYAISFNNTVLHDQTSLAPLLQVVPSFERSVAKSHRKKLKPRQVSPIMLAELRAFMAAELVLQWRRFELISSLFDRGNT